MHAIEVQIKHLEEDSGDLVQKRESEARTAIVTKKGNAVINFFCDGAVDKDSNIIGLGGITYCLKG